MDAVNPSTRDAERTEVLRRRFLSMPRCPDSAAGGNPDGLSRRFASLLPGSVGQTRDLRDLAGATGCADYAAVGPVSGGSAGPLPVAPALHLAGALPGPLNGALAPSEPSWVGSAPLLPGCAA